jgi:hypothetical protein
MSTPTRDLPDPNSTHPLPLSSPSSTTGSSDHPSPISLISPPLRAIPLAQNVSDPFQQKSHDTHETSRPAHILPLDDLDDPYDEPKSRTQTRTPPHQTQTQPNPTSTLGVFPSTSGPKSSSRTRSAAGTGTGPPRPPRSPRRDIPLRRRTESALSERAVQHLRATIRSFRASLWVERLEYDDHSSPSVYRRSSSDKTYRPSSKVRLQRSESATSTTRKATRVDMALSEQRSSRGLLDALLSDLGPGETWRPVPLPPRLRVMESLRQGHRRTHSSPGGPAKEEGEWHEMRRRTMSGPALPGDGVGEREPVESTAVYPAVEGVPTTAQPEQTARDPAVIATGAAAAVPQSFGTSLRQRDDTQGELVDHSPSPVFPMSTVPSPRPPDINSPSQRPVLSSPPYRPSPPELRITKPSLSPSDLELPTATTLFPVSSFDGRARGVHAFAAAQAARPASGGVDTAGMFQGGKQSAPAPVSMPVPDKGKGRALGERPAEGRQQTPRRGYIGPGGIVCA